MTDSNETVEQRRCDEIMTEIAMANPFVGGEHYVTGAENRLRDACKRIHGLEVEIEQRIQECNSAFDALHKTHEVLDGEKWPQEGDTRDLRIDVPVHAEAVKEALDEARAENAKREREYSDSLDGMIDASRVAEMENAKLRAERESLRAKVPALRTYSEQLRGDAPTPYEEQRDLAEHLQGEMLARDRTIANLKKERDEALQHLRKQQSRFSKLERAYRHQVKAGPDEVLKLRQDSSKKAVEIRRLKAERDFFFESALRLGAKGVELKDALAKHRQQGQEVGDG